MTITYKKYLILLMLITLSLLIIVASISYKIDPAMIYHKMNPEIDNSPAAFIDKLSKSSNGLLFPSNSWNERDIKSELAKNNNADCVILGSSHIMQISSFRNNASLNNVCPSIANLGISGGTLEDYLVMSYMLTSKDNKKPNTIILGVDPWSLALGRDSRWERYAQSYYLMKSLVSKNAITYDTNNQKYKYITNLINPQYFYRSLQVVKQDRLNKFKITKASKFDTSKGIKQPVILPDGSLIYSQDYISKAQPSKISTKGADYKIKNGLQHSNYTILIFKNLVKWLQNKNIRIIIVMTPYHHNVWQDKSSTIRRMLSDMEDLIRKISKELNTAVLGSYNPNKIGCKPHEFYDMMHAKDTCLAKIKN